MKEIFLENIPDLAEAQRVSFFNFLEKGIITELKTLDNPARYRYFYSYFDREKIEEDNLLAPIQEENIVTSKKRENSITSEDYGIKAKSIAKIITKEKGRTGDIYFSTEKIKIKGPNCSFEKSLIEHKSYCLHLFITAYVHLSIRKLTPRYSLANWNKYKKVIIERDFLLAELPLITDEGSFLITGYERIVINQIIRSPGVYFRKEYRLTKSQADIINHTATIISDKGIWLKIIMESDDFIHIKLNDLRGKSVLSKSPKDDKEKEDLEKHKLSLFEVLKYFRISAEEMFDNLNYPKDKEQKEQFISQLFESRDMSIFNRTNTIPNFFYNEKTGLFSIGEIGRFKINKRLGLNLPKEVKHVTSQDILLIFEKLLELKYSNAFIDEIDHIKNKQIRSIGDFLQKQLRIGLSRAYAAEPGKESEDFGRYKYEPEFITEADKKRFVKKRFFDPYPISSSLKEFFKVSELSQFMDQVNPLSELTQKRRVSVFGPNGLKRDHISTVIRDIHPSQYGRLCPIETPEGQNAGLVTSFALHSRVSSLGWLEAPYFFIENGSLDRVKKSIYLNPEQESTTKVAFCDTCLSSAKYIKDEYLSIKEDTSFGIEKKEDLTFLSFSPLQLLSVATTLIPFIEHNDANRALMGSNMQRQAVPLLCPQKAIVGTGLESTAIIDSNMILKSYSEGYVEEANSYFIEISDKYNQRVKYYLQKHFRSNQETSLNQKCVVWQGEKVFSGQIIADGASTLDGELALGRNFTVAYMPWEGYNYEDAIVLSERLVIENCLTSIHIEEYETTVDQFFEDDKVRKLNLTAIPPKSSKHLDENGVARIGSYLKEYDILFAKVIEIKEDELTPEKKLEFAITTKNSNKYPVKDASFKLPIGVEGRLIEIRIFSLIPDTPLYLEQEGFDINAALFFYKGLKKMKFFIAQARKIEVGDKLAGRHGNKGVISKILPIEDMPYLPNGRAIDILLNPLGVPSRMNVGQIFESLLGIAGENLGKRFKIKSFDEMYGEEASRILVSQKLKEASIKKNLDWLFNDSSPGKILLRDGRTGEYFDNPITVGKSYILKLIHLVQDKIHARDTGPYSMITEQPLAGKALGGGQRLGEMEVWALEAYGASYTLQELLTIKSDDIDGRIDIYESIFLNNLEKPITSMPEGFLILIRELNALGLDFSLKKLAYEKSNEKEYFVEIFNQMEKRLKLRALKQRKKVEMLIVKIEDQDKEKEKENHKAAISSYLKDSNLFNLLNYLQE